MPVSALEVGWEEGVKALLGATHLRTLSVDLDVLPMRAPARPDFPQVVASIMPHVSTLHVVAVRSLPFILDAGSTLTKLRALSVETTRPVAVAELQGLLDSVPCMTRLEQLRCVLTVPNPGEEDDGEHLDLGPLCGGLGRLTGLTRLEWIARGTARAGRYQQQVLSACSKLLRLATLQLGQLWVEAYADFARVVPQMPLRRLEVDVPTHTALEVVLKVVPQLPHLRQAYVDTGQLGVVARSAMQIVVATLPACDMGCDG